MTIAVAIRTGNAIVFAADSKVTTKGLGGFDANNEPIWIDQTYDNAYKIAHDRERRLMAMVAGHANIGRTQATDFIRRYQFPLVADLVQQDDSIKTLAKEITAEIESYWASTKVPKDQWPGPTLIIATFTPDLRSCRVWRGCYKLPDNPPPDATPQYEFEEILKFPTIQLEGAYREVYSLLYGVDWDAFEDVINKQLGIKPDSILKAIQASPIARPIDKINFHAMPTQDAIDLASFLAGVQIKMDRFLPGEAVCGGVVDVMLLELVPEPSIIPYLKVLHYSPRSG